MSSGTSGSEFKSAKSSMSIPRIKVQRDTPDSGPTVVREKNDVTGSLRSNKSGFGSTQRLGKLCVYIVIQRPDDPVSPSFSFDIVSLMK